MKYGIYINSPDFTKCGYVTTGVGTSNVKDYARRFDTQGDATDFIKTKGWKNSASVPAHGITAYTCELSDRTAPWTAKQGRGVVRGAVEGSDAQGDAIAMFRAEY